MGFGVRERPGAAEEAEEGALTEPRDLSDAMVATGVRSGKKLISAVAGLAVTAVIGSAGIFLFGDRQDVVVGVPTWTPQPSAVQPAPADINRPAVQVVEVYPQETEADRVILQDIQQLTTALDLLTAEVHARFPTPVPPALQTQDVDTAAAAESLDVVDEPALSVWEDGTCWTPADMQVLHLCGSDAGDGYVIRWVGVHGDSRGPEIPDSDYLAVRGGGDRLVWSGHHPATGEAVSVTYWAGGHVLAVHAAGRLLFRIDRNHATR